MSVISKLPLFSYPSYDQQFSLLIAPHKTKLSLSSYESLSLTNSFIQNSLYQNNRNVTSRNDAIHWEFGNFLFHTNVEL